MVYERPKKKIRKDHFFGIEKIDRFDKHTIFVKQKPTKRFGLDSKELFGIINNLINPQ